MSSFSIEVGEKATIIFAETSSAEKCRFVRNGSLWRTLAALPFAARRSPPGAPFARRTRNARTRCGATQCNARRRVTMRRKRRDAATVSPRVS
ncbi:hypothetical protein A8H35_10405 [Burkholderia thailandensis]|nr:hypothetical protein A8H35_10405 [Burkholderia thailandensis]AWY67054.1 hypothetical protein A8H36_18030 [Burkholderia thailandensis]NOK39999.1 hypothetical protein [Burkholderia thailandensis]NOK51545.1 hypothetical protein [Burkholderia thailandensis]PHH37233.1 hypothetical protein CRX59_11580 [Burkholderia thailandensis]